MKDFLNNTDGFILIGLFIILLILINIISGVIDTMITPADVLIAKQKTMQLQYEERILKDKIELIKCGAK